jgi:hypothetical protein
MQVWEEVCVFLGRRRGRRERMCEEDKQIL